MVHSVSFYQASIQSKPVASLIIAKVWNNNSERSHAADEIHLDFQKMFLSDCHFPFFLLFENFTESKVRSATLFFDFWWKSWELWIKFIANAKISHLLWRTTRWGSLAVPIKLIFDSKPFREIVSRLDNNEFDSFFHFCLDSFRTPSSFADQSTSFYLQFCFLFSSTVQLIFNNKNGKICTSHDLWPENCTNLYFPLQF